MNPLVIVTGTGTEIGKTHVAVALLQVWSRRASVVGLKPIESGSTPPYDHERLGQASTFHVTRCRPPYMYAEPVSPHLGARREGRPIDPSVILTWVRSFRDETAVLVELAGGLFSPLGDGLTNASLAKLLDPSSIVLVAPDRLGVLHDIGATTRAARAEGLALGGIVLNAPANADASTSRNAQEIALVTDVPVLATLPRGSSDELSQLEPLGHALDRLLSP